MNLNNHIQASQQPEKGIQDSPNRRKERNSPEGSRVCRPRRREGEKIDDGGDVLVQVVWLWVVTARELQREL